MPNLLDLYEAIKPKYIIFCDMDGVLVDFDKGYKDLTKKVQAIRTFKTKTIFGDY